uniref:HhH-GPD domain-containing protein n=1 Tax=Kalanchoe fedtschenkoi TaxID=63787 RepID=A0A7N0RHQ3_KALFE
MMNSGGYSIPKENEFQIMNRWVPATPNQPISSRGRPVPIQLQGSNLETANWQQLLEFPKDHALGSVGSYHPVQNLDTYRQAGRDGSRIFNPNSFMALLGVDDSYGVDGPLLENQGNNQVSQDYLSVHDNFSKPVVTLENNWSTMNPLPMTSQFVAQNKSFQSPRLAGANSSFQSPQFAGENRSFQPVSRPVIPNLNDHVSVNWIDDHSKARPLLDQNHHLLASACNASKDVFQLPEDRFLVPSRLEYDLNSPARTETEGIFSQTPDFFHHTSVTPNLAIKSQDSRPCEILKLPEPDRHTCLIGDKQMTLAENGTEQSSELPQPIVDTSSCVISTPEKIMGNDEGSQVIDLNKTPQHKAPKRRKHRPKVIREVKPKKTPKSETPKNPKSSERPKRKYTRKGNLNASETQLSGDKGGIDDLSTLTATKSCRRALSFEQEKMTEQRDEKSNTQPQLLHQMSGMEFNLKMDNQATETYVTDSNISMRESVAQMGRQNELPPCIHPAEMANKLTHSMPQKTVINRPQAARPPSTRTTTFQDLLMGNFNSAGGSKSIPPPTRTTTFQDLLMGNFNSAGGSKSIPPPTRTTSFEDLLMGNFNSAEGSKSIPPPTRTTTFQDLLMGNFNSAGSLKSIGKSNLNPNSAVPAMYTSEANIVGAESTSMCRQNELQTFYQHTNTTGNYNCSMPQQTTNIIPHAVRHRPTQATSFQELLMENDNGAQSNLSSQIVNVNQSNWRSYNPEQWFTGAKNNGQLALQDKNTQEDLSECGGQMVLYKSTQQVMRTSSIQNEERRSKRERDFISEQHRSHNITSATSSRSSRQVNQVDGYYGGYATRQELSDVEKKRRTESTPDMEMSNIGLLGSAESNSRQLQPNKGNNAHANMRASYFNPYPWMSYATDGGHSAGLIRTNRALNEVSASSAAFGHSSKQLFSSKQSSYISQLQKRDLDNVQVTRFPAPVSNYNLQPVPAKTHLSDDQQTPKSGSSNATTKLHSRPTASGLLMTHLRKAAPSGDTQAITTTLTNRPSKTDDVRSPVSSRKRGNDSRPPSSRKRGLLRKQDIRDLIDDIICQMSNLKLDTLSEDKSVQPENAIVPYKGDGSVVMYQVKKRKPRPKVDLDPESERIWKLLMGKEVAEGMEGTDADKEKWWEEERKVFRGRANSFIARMHLVQGDRRFSRWKGSVVDSVIGVFLTQNVSDHLSSSAFMSLAARFPLSLSSSRTSCTVEHGINEEPDICIIDLEDGQNNEAKQALSNAHSMASEDEGNILTIQTETVNSVDNQSRAANEETLSLESFDSSICLTYGGSCSGSNSEVEDQLSTPNPIVFNTNKGTGVSQGPQRVNLAETPVGSLTNPRNGRQPTVPSCEYKLPFPRASEKDWQPLLGGESTSSCPTCDAADCSSNTHDPTSQNRRNAGQNELPWEKIDKQPNLNEQSGSHIMHQEGILTTATSKETTQHSCSDCQHECLTFRSEQTSTIHEVTEPNLKEKSLSSAAHINSKGGSPKTRKGKPDADKKLIDWDMLRKEAQCNNKRPRTKDAMDSMDYETMRHADVKEISEAIKERGMNNMLAERIKAFLNRLVTDHGSTDLEWLRDAPPDKAKDYLLSIRGLGLKSVECVRLLTLHHLAFPVDTNVGRIAVRLGWVPLQPLPESLQLHLLELYPVLETIQKYLWPRLCKLDQRTLYELHYQMITFGKVFCTKSKPNCNACPMRAECRHFASAFASARLALPGPEEKNLVPSRDSVPFDRSPAIEPPSQPLLEWENQFFGVERLTKANCEPIIEEPTTPEQAAAELSEIDIEDSYGEDPDEIPIIRLDFQEFTHNLQSYMQENNMAVQDDDMSKALVALTAEAASLPPQKLKNVSRLRTEHQVYELPDSHPLIKEMDKREPDDPSPYLLAIWTPGETANSTQTPESQCQSEDPSKMCGEKTCFSCNSRREADSNIVRGTLLIPCRTAMRGSFPLNGTYFQVNEMFADHESSINPIDVPREWIWNLPRRTVYFGTSVSTIFKGLSTEGIQYCFWRGFVCVRGFDQRCRAPRPLLARLHHPASRLVKKSK